MADDRMKTFIAVLLLSTFALAADNTSENGGWVPKGKPCNPVLSRMEFTFAEQALDWKDLEYQNARVVKEFSFIDTALVATEKDTKLLGFLMTYVQTAFSQVTYMLPDLRKLGEAQGLDHYQALRMMKIADLAAAKNKNIPATKEEREQFIGLLNLSGILAAELREP